MRPKADARNRKATMIGPWSLTMTVSAIYAVSQNTASTTASTVIQPLNARPDFMSTTEPDSKKLKMSSPEKPRIIALFDVDGTLTIPRGEVTKDMMQFMHDLSKKITVGIVGGSDLPKQAEQLGEGIENVFPYNFSQNGLVAYKNGELMESQTIAKFLGEDNIKRVVNWVLKYFSELDLPVKVGLFL
jgi:hypothetical protein